MQDLLDTISDRSLWSNVEPLVRDTFSHIGELFEKFNNKLAYIQNTIYSKQKHKHLNEVDNKTLLKQHKVTWKSPLRETVGGKNKHSCHETLKNKNKKVKEIVPQQLYLESNQTMFAMIVDEIQKLKRCKKPQKQSKSRQSEYFQWNENHRMLQNRQNQLEDQIRTLIAIVNNNDRFQQQPIEFFTSSQVPVIPTEITMKLFQIQKQLMSKPSLDTISQLIQNQYSEIANNFQQLEQYTSTNLTSINKILNHQSSINLEVCREMRMGKWIWEGKQKTKLTLVPWEKQIVNLFPESVIWSENTTTLLVKEAGFYKIDLFVIGENSTIGIILNDDNSLFRKEQVSFTFSNEYSDVLEVSNSSSLSISSENETATIIMILQKIV